MNAADLPLKTLLVQHEGMKFVVYDDATGLPLKIGDTLKGNPTLGIGCNLVEPVSQAVVDLLYAERVTPLIGALSNSYPWFPALDPVRQRAMIDMAFNVGLGGLQKSPKMLAAMAARDYHTASVEMLDGEWSVQVGQRAIDLAEMIRSGASKA